MQVVQANEHVLADLQVAALLELLVLHHEHERLIPLVNLVACGLVDVEAAHQAFVNERHVEVARTQHVLHLPQVEEVFGDVFFSLLIGNEHSSE